MESWPLIKKNVNSICGDVTHVVRETFHDFFDEKITQSEFTYSANCPIKTELRNNANDIKEVFVEHQHYIRDIQKVEQVISKDIITCIDRDKFIRENVIANSNMKLRKHPVFKDLDPEMVKKYNLIQSDDLLPTPIDRITDFTYDYDLRNHYKKHLESNTYGSLIHCNYAENSWSKSQFGLCPVNEKKVKKDCFESKHGRKKLEVLQLKPTTSCGIKEPVKNTQIRLRAEPENVLFYDYEINVSYEQLVKIRNIAGSITRLTIPVFNDHSKFKIVWKHLTTSLTPGMCITFIVQFFTQTYDDTQTYLQFRVKDGKDLIIKLISKRPAPLLTGIMFYGSSCINWNHGNITTTQINTVLNSTIECKQCLIGAKNEIILSLCKYGADASFFLVSEYSWYNMVVNEINTNLEIKLPPFTIYPAYFKIKSNEIIDIHVEFAPQEFGLHLNKLIIICDNCTYDYIDLVGDGVYFQPDYINLQAAEKDYSVIHDSDYESKHLLNLGTVLTFRKSPVIDIYVTNKSVLKFNYRWKLRPPAFRRKTKTSLQMSPNWIKLIPLNGHLNSETDSKFTLSVMGNSYKGGSYRYVIEFYITEIPVAALADNHKFTVVDSKQDEGSNLVDVLIGEIELWLNIEEASIIIDPCSILIYVKEGRAITRQITVLNLCNHSLNCVWINKLMTIEFKICPQKFVLEANQIFHCKLEVKSRITKDISTEFRCQVLKTNVEMCLPVNIIVTIPIIETSTHVLNFGHVKYAANVSKLFRIFGKGTVPLKWCITEYIYDFITHSLRKAVKPSLNDYYGVLDANNGMKYDLEYSMWTGKSGKWCSILIITTQVASEIQGTDFVLVFGEIVTPPLLNIIAPPSLTPVLRIPISYINVKKLYYIQLHNITSIRLSYIWDQPQGRDISKLHFFMFPSHGTIPPMGKIKTMIVIEAKEVGEVTNFRVPCFVGGNLEPLWLSVETTNKDICVLIYQAYKSYPQEHVKWPPMEDENNLLSILSSECTTTSTTYISKSYEDLSTGPNKTLSYHNSEESLIHYEPGGRHIDWKFTNKCSVEQRSDVRLLNLPSEMSYSRNSSKHSFISSNSENKSASPYQMEFRLKNINLRTAHKRTVLIKNITPVTANYRVYAKNFGFSDIRISLDFIDSIETELSNKKDRWTHHLSKTCVGFVLQIRSKYRIIPPNDYFTFDIWLYGDTWGTYQDEITIEIERQPPFKINLIVDIIGQPIMFPMLCDNVKKLHKSIPNYPNIRFGTMAYESDSVTRKVKVKNISAVNIIVVWHVFLQQHKGHRKDERVSVHQRLPPFNLVLDLYDSPNATSYNENFTRVELLSTKYWGDEDSYIFTVHPKQMKIKPQATDVIEITFNPQEFHPIWGEVKLEAFIVGHVKISKKDSYSEGAYSRKSLTLSPIKIRLEAVLVLPLTNLQLLQGDIKFKVFAVNVISQFKRTCIYRTFVMRNTNNVPINARLHIQPPFKIIEVKTKEKDEKTTKNKTMDVYIEPGLCAEILLKCSFNKKFIKDISENIEINVGNASNYSISNKTVVIPHELVIEQPNLITQRVPLEIVITYPDITISKVELDFGPVSIGYQKTLSFSITNRTCSDIEFSITKTSGCPCFVIEPSTGTLSKVLAGRWYRFDVDVTFIPSEIEWYLEKLYICVGKTNYIQDIILQGNGISNLRYV